jgi:hypothetical protein
MVASTGAGQPVSRAEGLEGSEGSEAFGEAEAGRRPPGLPQGGLPQGGGQA